MFDSKSISIIVFLTTLWHTVEVWTESEVAVSRSNYYHDVNFHHKRHYRKRIILIIFIVLFLASLVIGGFMLDSWLQSKKSVVPSKPTVATESTYSPTIQYFRTSYFQFQAGANWRAIEGETTANKFVYRSNRSTIVDHEIIFYVNKADDDKQITHVLPVVKNAAGDKLFAGTISEHCRKKVPPVGNQSPQIVTLSDVKFLCNPQSNNFVATVGIVGDAVPMKLSRPNGTQATYSIVYRNLTATPDDNQLRSIVESFQTR